MAKKTATKKRINKTAFVLSQSSSMSAAEVVAAAKKAGIAIGDKYVYNIRAKAKASGGTKKKIGRPKRQAAVSNGHASETAFMEMAVDIGLGRARELLDTLGDRIKATFA